MPDDELQCVHAEESNQNGTSSLRKLIETLKPVFRDDPASWHLDLTHCKTIGIWGATLISSVLLGARTRGRRPRVTLPTTPAETVELCASCGLTHYATGSERLTIENVDRFDVPIAQFLAPNYVSDATDIIVLLRSCTEIDEELEDRIRSCISEAIQNVCDHANSTIGAMMGARIDSQQKRIFIAIVDCGVGISQTLKKRYPKILNAGDAIGKIINGGYSARTRSNNQGLGVSNICSIVRNVLHGTVCIVSDNAIAAGNATEDWSISDDLAVRFPGTGVFLSFPYR